MPSTYVQACIILCIQIIFCIYISLGSDGHMRLNVNARFVCFFFRYNFVRAGFYDSSSASLLYVLRSAQDIFVFFFFSSNKGNVFSCRIYFSECRCKVHFFSRRTLVLLKHVRCFTIYARQTMYNKVVNSRVKPSLTCFVFCIVYMVECRFFKMTVSSLEIAMDMLLWK